MLTLYIGNKNYSSWSLRAWLLLRQLDIPFAERKLSLFGAEFYREIAEVSGAARVPVLVDDGFSVWDTLAIAEYVAESFPEKRVWPEAREARARARSVCAEMHAGFRELRDRMPMNIEAELPGRGLTPGVQRDIDRIREIWQELRVAHADAGPFLFGEFCAADAFYAPVVSRFVTYGVVVEGAAATYMRSVQDLASLREWTLQALDEKSFLPEDEPYRESR